MMLKYKTVENNILEFIFNFFYLNERLFVSLSYFRFLICKPQLWALVVHEPLQVVFKATKINGLQLSLFFWVLKTLQVQHYFRTTKAQTQIDNQI